MKLIFAWFLLKNRALLKYLCLYHKYICTHERRVFFKTFSAASWISVMYMLYSPHKEMKYWILLDRQWNEYLYKHNNI